MDLFHPVFLLIASGVLLVLFVVRFRGVVWVRSILLAVTLAVAVHSNIVLEDNRLMVRSLFEEAVGPVERVFPYGRGQYRAVTEDGTYLLELEMEGYRVAGLKEVKKR